MSLSSSLVAQIEPITIPTVVHVIYSDSIPTNITDDQIYSAIEALNDDFRRRPNTQGLGNGVDTEIEFCLATRDPFSNITNGIELVFCAGLCAENYDSIGLDPAINEQQVKNISRWPSEEYYNIWVVSELSGSMSNEVAFTRGCDTVSSVDGTVILFSAFGIGSQFTALAAATDSNRTITHEAGHWLGLLDTYEGDMGGTVCPTNNVCDSAGDKICDTPPHIRSNGSCADVGICGLIPEDNYMNNASESCRSAFTLGQKAAMDTTLLAGCRTLILESMGCQTPTLPPPTTDCAIELISNGDFESVTPPLVPPNDPASESLLPINNWIDFNAPNNTPWYCNDPDNIYLGIRDGVFGSNESIYSEDPLVYNPTSTYRLTFDYSIQRRSACNLPIRVFAFVSSDPTVAPGGASFIGSTPNTLAHYPSSAGFYPNTDYFCYPGIHANPQINTELEWETYSQDVTIPVLAGSLDEHLRITAIGGGSCEYNIYIDNISICQCPSSVAPEITYGTEKCDAGFSVAISPTVPAGTTYTWNFGDGSPELVGSSVNHAFSFPGDFRVCVTYDDGCNVDRVCEIVTISEDEECDGCEERTLAATAVQCSNGAFIANYESIGIPAGAVPCNEDGQMLYSPGASINIQSIETNAAGDRLNIALEVTPDDPDFTNKVDAYLTLCDDQGNKFCYKFTSSISGEQCDDCEQVTISPSPICFAEEGGDEFNVYYGSFTISSPPFGFMLCSPGGNVSTIAGLELTGNTGNTFDYSITTRNNDPFSGEVILRFCDDSGESKCYRVNIDVNTLCPRDPEENQDEEGEGRSDRLVQTSVELGSVRYTNPSNGQLVLFTDMDDLDLQIISLQGQIVFNAKDIGRRIALQHLTPGVYIARFSSQGSLVDHGKLLIQY